MLQAGIKPDVQAMNSLINAFSKAGSPDQALKVGMVCALCIRVVCVVSACGVCGFPPSPLRLVHAIHVTRYLLVQAMPVCGP